MARPLPAQIRQLGNLGTKYFEFDSYKISKETLDSKTKATCMVTLSYKDGAVTTLFAIMTKTGEGWKFDMKQTVLFEKKRNGAHAFSAVKLKKKVVSRRDTKPRNTNASPTHLWLQEVPVLSRRTRDMPLH